MPARLDLTEDQKKERLRAQNRESQARHRRRRKAAAVAESLAAGNGSENKISKVSKDIGDKKSTLPMVPLSSLEFIWLGARAGEIAAYLRLHLQAGHELLDEAAIREWLDDPAHSLGASVVWRFLASWGLGEDFRRWRG